MRTNLARRVGAVALAAALGLGLAACEDEPDKAASTGADSSRTTGDETTGDEGTGDEGSGAGLEELPAAQFHSRVMDAMMEAETFTMESESTVQGVTTTVEGQVRFASDGLEMSATSTGGPEDMELVLVDKVMYLRTPSMSTDGTWMRIDLTDEGSLLGMLGKSLDPQVAIQALKDPEKLELLGEEEVDGVPTNHYRVTIDPQRFREALDLPEQMASHLPEEMVFDYWIDADDLPRKMVQESTAKGPDGAPVTTDLEAHYRGFGDPVTITVPPADQVTDAPKLGTGGA
ncbi:MAG: hypothetical protein LT071_02880 [Nocardioides sp.]|nr:hypothetical protein [Nocardioides sp.]